jgi:hypothetical protein
MSTIKRGKVYYTRLYVPSELRQILHKREVVKSLRTSSHAEAITRSCILKGRVVRLWSVLKSERISMTPKQINKLIQQYTKATLEECEEGRLNNLKNYNDDELEGVILLSKSGHKESDEYNHFWRCSVWERSAINIQKSIKLKQSV